MRANSADGNLAALNAYLGEQDRLPDGEDDREPFGPGWDYYEALKAHRAGGVQPGVGLVEAEKEDLWRP